MAVALVTLSIGNNTLIAAEEGKIIRVARIVGSPSSDFTLRSDAAAVLPELKTGANSHLDIGFPEGNVQTARGAALKAYATTGPFTLWIVYELVD
jgi:hypothetical protein